MFYEIDIVGKKRKLPLFPVEENLSIAAFILFEDVEITIESAKALLEKSPAFDVILTAEAKSIPLAYEMAKQSKKEYVIARKGKKVYMEGALFTKVDSITTQSRQTLYLGERDAAVLKGKKVLIIDDVISTGESLTAMEMLTEQAEGEIAGKMAVLSEGSANDRDDIIVLGKLPLFNRDGTIKE